MPPHPKQLLTAAWVAPIATPLLRDGGVVIEQNRILDVGPAKALRTTHPDAHVVELGDHILFPGLVNAHCHLDLTAVPRPAAPASFIDWVQQLIRFSIAHPEPGFWAASTVRGAEQCLRFGVTSVGDIAGRFPAQVRAALTDRARWLDVTSYGEVTAMAQRRALLAERLGAAIAGAAGANAALAMRIGVSPHAPYSVEPEGYRQCLAAARQLGLPLATHLAETPYEAEFLATHTGPFRDLWSFLGAWDDHVPTFAGGPIRYAKALGLLDYDATLLAHVNYCDDDELSILAAGTASVAYCPRTHAYFGHPPHRWRDMLARGVNVALGTDSAASAPDLNLLDDLRLLHRLAPDVPAETLWELVTVNAAKAIANPTVGSIAPGRSADLIAFPAGSDHPLLAPLGNDAPPKSVWLAGAIRHPRDAPPAASE